MKIGIPKGLLYYKYHPFMERFFIELGAEVIVSEDTNKGILNEGVKLCVDEACLPIKVFHGHVESIKDKCDILLIPRIMRIREKEFMWISFPENRFLVLRISLSRERAGRVLPGLLSRDIS